jgi:hypothetical protein
MLARVRGHPLTTDFVASQDASMLLPGTCADKPTAIFMARGALADMITLALFPTTREQEIGRRVMAFWQRHNRPNHVTKSALPADFVSCLDGASPLLPGLQWVDSRLAKGYVNVG